MSLIIRGSCDTDAPCKSSSKPYRDLKAPFRRSYITFDPQ